MLQLLITRSENRGRGEPRGGEEGKGEGKKKTHTHTKTQHQKKKSPSLRSSGTQDSIQSVQKIGSGMSCDLRPQSSSVPHNYLIQHSPCQIQ